MGSNLEVDWYFEGTKFVTFGAASEVALGERSVYFDNFGATDTYLDAGDVNDLDNKDFTISAWIRRDSGQNKFDIVSKRDYYNEDQSGGDTYTHGYAFRINQTGQFRMVWRDPEDDRNNQLQTNESIPENEWHHVAATYDISENMAILYIDGIHVYDSNDYLADRGVPLEPMSVPSDSHFMIGAAHHIKRQQRIRGSIDEVRVWNVALSSDEIRYIMNQEIEKNDILGTEFVNGKVLPSSTTKNEIITIPWNNLIGYYPMQNAIFGSIKDESNSGNDASMINFQNIDLQTAPLPYKTKAGGTGSWDDEDSWENGDVQYLPGVVSYLTAGEADDTDKETIDYNIVQIDHNIRMSNSDSNLIPNYKDNNRILLGLIVNSGADLQIDGNIDALFTSDKGNGITVSHYLKVDGTIDLEGESQLIQTQDSDLDTASTGALERDQQGTRDLFTYNYWSSPVSKINGGVSGINNLEFELDADNILKNGSIPGTPNDITYTTTGYNGSLVGNNMEIADYWIWKYANNANNDYTQWQFVGSSNPIKVGEGYTMKGVADTGGMITQQQNYTFYGKPNNGDFTLTINSGNDYLIGNPYPSAMDADEFIKDNLGVLELDSDSNPIGRNVNGNIINGTLYFWDHFASGSHYLAEYQGGYATYTLMGGAVAVNSDIRIDATGDLGTKAPKRYIPVGQGFFVSSVLDSDLIGEANDPEIDQTIVGGSIEFKNSQRIFIREDEGSESAFIRNSNEVASNSNSNIDTRQKIRIKFSSPEGYHRQLLVGVDESASDGFDIGFDGPLIETNVEEMYWRLHNGKLIIQAVNDFNEDQILPLGIKIASEGYTSIKIDDLENIDSSTNIYVHDIELGIYHDLRESDFEIFLGAGDYTDRFEITFGTEDTLTINDQDVAGADVYFSNDLKSVVINNPNSRLIKSVEIFNVIGQSIVFFETGSYDNNIHIKTDNITTGVYIIKMKVGNNDVTKKVMVN
ncbi:MAG: T9SS type A sorting domain-containing protein, partial [Psychroserpens sp.]|nr:T9SS type A sorting domain-containing protein [Psychroserpens sp.]